MRLDPAGAPIAPEGVGEISPVVLNRFTRRTAARDAHFETRGRLIARQPAQHHRLTTRSRRSSETAIPCRLPRGANEEAETN